MEEVQPEVQETESQVKTEEAKTYTEEEVKAREKALYDKLNATLSRQGAEIKKLRELQNNPQSNVTKSLVDEIEKLGNSAYQDDPQAQSRLAQLRKQVQEEERRAVLVSQARLIQNKKDELFEELRDAGVDTDDPTVTADLENALDYELWMGDGTFKWAERIKNKILKSVPKKENKVEETKETETQMRERLEREILEEHGLTKDKELSPSKGGKSYTREQIANMSPAEYAENKSDILTAYTEGRIK